MEQITKIFIALVRSEICQSPLESEVLSAITPDMIKSLYVLAKSHDMVYLVAVALKKQKLLGEDELSQLFSRHIYATLLRYESIKSEQNQIYQVFEKEGIVFVPLKGAVIRAYYPEPWIRTSCDIDILVREEDLERAKEALVSSLGYTVGKYNYHDISMYTTANVHVELHFKILENEEQIDPLLEKVWDYVGPVAPGRSQYAMTPEYLIFHVMAHMCYHFINGGCGVRFVMDMWLLKNNLPYKEDILLQLCQLCGLDTFASAVGKLSGVWFGEDEHDAITKNMEQYIVHSGIFGTSETKVMARKTKTDGRGKYLLGRIFMPYKEARASYPKLEKYPFLYPYYVVVRWFKIFDRTVARQAMNEVKLNKDMETEQVAQLKELFTNLKLNR